MKKVLRNIKSGWMAFARAFARVQTVVIVTALYFLVIAPFGLLLTLFGWDPLERKGFRRTKSDIETNWKPVKTPRSDPGSMRRMS